MHQALVSEERHSKKYRAEEKSAFFLSCRETDQMSKSTVCYLCLLQVYRLADPTAQFPKQYL